MSSHRFPGLTVRQPRAWGVQHGGIDVLNMSWYTRHRGSFWLHAGSARRWDWTLAVDPVMRAVWEDYWRSATSHPFSPPLAPLPVVPYSAIVALSAVTGCHPADECLQPGALGSPDGMCSPWAQKGYWHWELGGTTSLTEPVGCRGWLMWGWVPRSVHEQARKNMPC